MNDVDQFCPCGLYPYSLLLVVVVTVVLIRILYINSDSYCTPDSVPV